VRESDGELIYVKAGAVEAVGKVGSDDLRSEVDEKGALALEV
jgi:hypothetical protein